MKSESQFVFEIGIVRLGCDSFFVVTDRVLQLVTLQFVVGLCRFHRRFKLGLVARFLFLVELDFFLCLLGLTKSAQSERQLVVGLRLFGAHGDGLLELLARRSPILEEDQHHAEFVVRVGKTRIDRDRLLEERFGSGIITHRAKNNAIEIEDLSIVRALCEKLWSDGTRGVDVVGENENAEELQFGFRIAGIDVNDVLREVDRVLIANLLDQDHDEGARKWQRRLGGRSALR